MKHGYKYMIIKLLIFIQEIPLAFQSLVLYDVL